MLELWQRVTAGSRPQALTVETVGAFCEALGRNAASIPAGAALWAFLKVVAAESSGTAVEAVDRDPAGRTPPIKVQFLHTAELPFMNLKSCKHVMHCRVCENMAVFLS